MLPDGGLTGARVAQPRSEKVYVSFSHSATRSRSEMPARLEAGKESTRWRATVINQLVMVGENV